MKKIFIYAIVFLSLLSCNDYLDIEPKDQVIPSSVRDYDLLLAGITDLEIELELFLSADDYITTEGNLGDLNNPNNNLLHLYSFSDARFSNPDLGASGWNDPYKDVYIFNKVINEVDNAEIVVGYDDTDIKIIKAEAQYGRAMRYLLLANMFSKHYNATTASSDVSVPLVTIADTSQDSPKASTVEEAYNFIITDLEAAIPNLPAKRKELNRPSKGSGYALLSRAYLYKGNYDKALENAELAIAESGTLSDLTTAPDIRAALKSEQYTELTYGYIRGFYQGFLSPEILGLFDTTNDVRITRISPCQNPDCTIAGNGYAIEPNIDCSVSEMYLTIAECAARKGEMQKALDNANKVAEKRINGYVAKEIADFADNTAILKFVLNERRRELFMDGTRLFDLKRLNLESDFAVTVSHPLNTDTFTAEPNSGKLVLPVPAQVRKLNPNL